MLKIGPKLKSFRESRKLSQQEMAKILKIPQSTYSRHERQDADPPMGLFLDLCLHFGQEAFDLFFPLDPQDAGPQTNIFAEKAAPWRITPGEAAQRASAILREVKVAAPQLRELWTDQDEDEFLGGITQLLISVPTPEVAGSLQNLLVSIALGTVNRKKSSQEDAGSRL